MNASAQNVSGTAASVPGFRGWAIVGVSFAVQMVAFGCTIATYGLFIPTLTAEFGASFLQANLGLSLLSVSMALTGLVIGPLLDRWSIRSIMVAGALVNAGAFVLLAQTTELWHMALVYGGIVAVGTTMFGPLAANTVVAKWFERNRGRAVGVASMGAPAGGLLLSPLVGQLLANFGWRPTLLLFAGMHLLLLPLIWTVIRNRPEDLGQQVDGGPAGVTLAHGAAPPVAAMPQPGLADRAWTTGQIMRSANFWSLAVGLGLIGAVLGAFNANIVPYAADLGIELGQAALFVAALGGTAIAGTLLFGALADTVDNRLLLWIGLVMEIGALLGLRLMDGGFAALLAMVLCLGLAAGGIAPLVASIIGRAFGALSFGRVMGLIGPVTLPFAFVGPPLAGWLRQESGTYLATFDAFIGGLVAAMLALLWLRLPALVARSATAPTSAPVPGN